MPKPRNKGNKPLKPKLHIFCEGEKTEPIYLNGYLNKFHDSNRRLQVVKVQKTKKNTPVQLVEEAIKLKDVTPPQDIFWVVYDRESKSKYSDFLHKKALDQALKYNINVSLTNVCFEVWILLHFVNSSAPYSSCKNLLSQSQLKSELKKHGITKYDKANKAIFDLISDKATIDSARQRAERMNKTTIGNSNISPDKTYQLNPYTGVHYLLDAIDSFL